MSPEAPLKIGGRKAAGPSLLPMIRLLIVCLSAAAGAGSALAAGASAPVWVVAVGEAQGSDYDPPKEVMERARNEAKRRAVDEAVGTFLRSHTLVSNGQLEEEFTYAQVRGRIEEVKILGEERDREDPNLFRVKLKALVSPVLPQERGLEIKLALSRHELKEGDRIQIHYQVNADSYVYIFSIAADNSVTLLFPNRLLHDNHARAGTGYVFPPDNASIHLEANSLPGMRNKPSREKVKLIATRGREILLEKGFQEGIFQVYDARSTGLVGDLARKLNQLEATDWGEAVTSYTITP
ncbi:DUF4384 domain-containing protein [Geomonas sp. Red32]|uniref:DUF4384 domain-containing protein n=1 Tax=Geomonas sp. Red32 TaxID=2912856 RepID=UPI00202CFC1C|nr:DUF4384 domain-containing protein [Geomonas sp. Red32]MCM0080562.1 DUF4384 domain-containing protein [Geomonas sp. Red32]